MQLNLENSQLKREGEELRKEMANMRLEKIYLEQEVQNNQHLKIDMKALVDRSTKIQDDLEVD